MDTTEDPFELPRTLRPSRLRLTLLFIVSIMFVAGGAWMVRENNWVGYPAIVFFGLGVLVIGGQLLLPGSSYLRLEADAFTTCTLYRSRRIPWSHVREFGLCQVNNTTMIGWNYTDLQKPKGRGAQISRAISGYEAALPNTYGLKPEDLLHVLETLRLHYGSSAG